MNLDKGIFRGVLLKNLVKHLFISGMPGKGKTIATYLLLLQLYGFGVPSLVLESANTNYRVLKTLVRHALALVRRLAQALRIYTPGMETISPFRHNPLWRPPGISRDEHIERLLDCFKAAFPMDGPLPALLAEALELVYDEHPDPDDPPLMVDLYAAARAVLAAKEYSAEVESNLMAALEVRVGTLTRRSIGRIFQCKHGAPSIESLIRSYSILELDHLPPEVACLLTLFLLTAIHAHVRTTPFSGRGPRFVIVIEEAHNIVGRNRDASPSEANADPKAYAAELVCRMLAELRILGVPIVIIDQLPSAVAPEVIKNTATKLAFGQVDGEEREVIGNAMLFGPVEMEEIARFVPGDAYFFTEGYHGPRRIRTVDLASELNLPPTPLNEAILPYIQDDEWFISDWVTRSMDELAQLKRRLDEFEDRRKLILNEVRRVHASYKRLLTGGDSSQRPQRLLELVRRCRAMRQRLETAFLALERGPYRNLLGADLDAAADNLRVRDFRSALQRRFETTIAPETTKQLDHLDVMVARFRKLQNL